MGFTYEFEWDDAEVPASLHFEIEYSYSPGTPDVLTLPNGDPGYPGSSPFIEIDSVALIRVVSEKHDRKPLVVEAAYWEKVFQEDFVDHGLLDDNLYEAGPEALDTEMNDYYEDMYDDWRENDY